MNANIIDQFNKLVKLIEIEQRNAQLENNVKEMQQHSFRLQSIKRALSILKKLDFEITDSSDLKNVSGIGKGTLARIDEILKTGTLAELKHKYGKKKQRAIENMQELEQVIGIGPVMAKKIVTKHGIRSVEELQKAIKSGKIHVGDSVLMGLKYYGIVQINIPREEITNIQKYLKKKAREIDPKLEPMICGSYRRGKKTSGDVDVLLYHPNVKTTKDVRLEPYLKMLVDNLKEDEFIVDDIKNSNIKYMGFCKFKTNPVRRLDIRYIPYHSLATAILYFTGPFELNTVMRETAKKKGMLLNEYGLYKVSAEGPDVKIKTETEEDVFNALGMKYLSPKEREMFSYGREKKEKKQKE